MELKRLVAAILAFLALASFAGCKGEKKDDSASTSAEAAGAQASETESGSDAETASEAAETQKASTESVKMNPRTNTPYYFLDLYMESFGSNEWNNWVPISEGDYVNGKYVIRDEYFYETTEYCLECLIKSIDLVNDFLINRGGRLSALDRENIGDILEEGMITANSLTILKPYEIGEEIITERDIYIESNSRQSYFEN